MWWLGRRRYILEVLKIITSTSDLEACFSCDMVASWVIVHKEFSTYIQKRMFLWYLIKGDLSTWWIHFIRLYGSRYTLFIDILFSLGQRECNSIWYYTFLKDKLLKLDERSPDDADSTYMKFFLSFCAGLTESLFLPHKDTYIEYEKVSLRLLYKAKVCPKLLISIFRLPLLP